MIRIRALLSAIVTAVLAPLILSVSVAPGAAARAHLQTLHFGRSVPILGPARGDGTRWVAYESTHRRLVVIDDRTGTRRSVAHPSGCRPPAHGGGWVVAVGGGEVLVSCDESSAQSRIYDIRHRLWRNPVGFSILPSPDLTSGPTVGRYWLSLTVTNPNSPFSDRLYLQWHTGRVHRDSAARPWPRSPRKIPDPDVPAGYRRMCAPLRRPVAVRYLHGVIYITPPYDGRREAMIGRDPRHPNPLGTLVVRGCGGHLTTVGSGTCDYPQLGSGLLSWAEGNRVRILRLATNRGATAFYRLYHSGGVFDGGDTVVTHTSKRVYSTFARDRLRSAPIPRQLTAAAQPRRT